MGATLSIVVLEQLESKILAIHSADGRVSDDLGNIDTRRANYRLILYGRDDRHDELERNYLANDAES